MGCSIRWYHFHICINSPKNDLNITSETPKQADRHKHSHADKMWWAFKKKLWQTYHKGKYILAYHFRIPTNTGTKQAVLICGRKRIMRSNAMAVWQEVF